MKGIEDIIDLYLVSSAWVGPVAWFFSGIEGLPPEDPLDRVKLPMSSTSR
jgi:hypothetical protein